ncbi:hypothetical protein FSP39_008091 [Pinctada imbricata]|uniref:Palmitoyltransferase n=1 Tax=Pinctada imbricata TaxID=66713 RepID=A0AA89BM14_PINIB|nr:hypothetical protein FSP39_008091 [Pinctada imbricata]
MKLCSCIQRSCKTCSCGASLFIRVFHTVLILGVPITLLVKKSALKTALVEFQDPVYGISYMLLLLLSLTAYYTACFMDPGYIHVGYSKRRKKLKREELQANQEVKGSDSDNSVEEFSIQIHKKSREVEEDHVPMLQCDEQVIDTDKLFRYCDYCEAGQPMRTRHCEDCKLCVRKYDHHCPWLETCVGERNHKYFWLFLCTKATRSVGFLRRNLSNCPTPVRSQAYTVLVRPVLEYASVVWDPYQQHLIQQLESVQRHAARFATGNYRSRDPGCVTAMIDHLGWEPLQHRRARNKVIMFYKIYHHIVEVPVHHLFHNTREGTRASTANNIRQISTRVDTYKYSFIPSTIIAWNNIPPAIRNTPTVDSFRHALSSISVSEYLQH